MAKFLELEKQSNWVAKPSDTNPSNSKEVDDDMTEPTASLEHTTHVPYEVRTEGPLTYFHYYFEEAGSTVDGGTGIVQQSPAKFLPNRYLVGAGVLTATALSGLALADINKSQVSAKPNVPEPGVQQKTPKATDSTKRLNLIGTEVQPLQANQPLWSNQANPGVGNTPSAKLMASATTQQRSPKGDALKGDASKAQTAGQSNALSTRTQPLRFSLMSLPRPTGGMSAVQKPKPVATLQQPKSVVPQTPQATEPQPLPSPQSSPQSSPQALPSSPALSRTTVPTENKSIAGSQAAGIARPEILAPQASDASTQSQAPAPIPAQTALPSPSVSAQPMTQGSQRLETALPEQAGEDLQSAPNPALSEKDAAKESLGALNAQSVLPQSIQDLLKRSRPLPTEKTVSVIPLTQKAAEDVLAMNKAGLLTDKAGRFTILHFNLQDYQKAWLARNKATQQPILVDAFPTYGFVDYQARIIAVLDQKQPLSTSLRVGMLTPEK
jgi:hypothetical protein